MNENVAKFYALYASDAGLRQRIADAEAMYPGSLEIRDAVVEDIVLPIAEELGLPFTLRDLRIYELTAKTLQNRDEELTEEQLSAPDDDASFWLIDRGWEYGGNPFEEKDKKEE